MSNENIITNTLLKEKIEKIKERIARRNANPEWQEICMATRQLRLTPCGKALARKLIQDFLEREKQNIRQ